MNLSSYIAQKIRRSPKQAAASTVHGGIELVLVDRIRKLMENQPHSQWVPINKEIAVLKASDELYWFMVLSRLGTQYNPETMHDDPVLSYQSYVLAKLSLGMWACSIKNGSSVLDEFAPPRINDPDIEVAFQNIGGVANHDQIVDLCEKLLITTIE